MRSSLLRHNRPGTLKCIVTCFRLLVSMLLPSLIVFGAISMQTFESRLRLVKFVSVGKQQSRPWRRWLSKILNQWSCIAHSAVYSVTPRSASPRSLEFCKGHNFSKDPTVNLQATNVVYFYISFLMIWYLCDVTWLGREITCNRRFPASPRPYRDDTPKHGMKYCAVFVRWFTDFYIAD